MNRNSLHHYFLVRRLNPVEFARMRPRNYPRRHHFVLLANHVLHFEFQSGKRAQVSRHHRLVRLWPCRRISRVGIHQRVTWRKILARLLHFPLVPDFLIELADQRFIRYRDCHRVGPSAMCAAESGRKSCTSLLPIFRQDNLLPASLISWVKRAALLVWKHFSLNAVSEVSCELHSQKTHLRYVLFL